MFEIVGPYALFLGDTRDRTYAKTAFGIAHWRPDLAVAQVRLPGATVRLDLPDVSVAQAASLGARTLIVGVTPDGGAVSEAWIPTLRAALEAGLDLGAGLHQRLADIASLADLAAREGRRIHDIRHPRQNFEVGAGIKRTGRRLLTIGTDCAVGKKYTALSIAREMALRGIDTDFRATGQTGIFISGGGVCVDTVVADFISGAAEAISPSAAEDHWDIVEGQGSLFHPSYAGVSLGLLHGSQPDALILCHEEGRTNIIGAEHHPIPDLRRCIGANLDAARLTNVDVRCVGVSLNTESLSEADARRAVARVAAETGLPAVDPVRFGVAPIVDHLQETFSMGTSHKSANIRS